MPSPGFWSNYVGRGAFFRNAPGRLAIQSFTSRSRHCHDGLSYGTRLPKSLTVVFLEVLKASFLECFQAFLANARARIQRIAKGAHLRRRYSSQMEYLGQHPVRPTRIRIGRESLAPHFCGVPSRQSIGEVLACGADAVHVDRRRVVGVEWRHRVSQVRVVLHVDLMSTIVRRGAAADVAAVSR